MPRRLFYNLLILLSAHPETSVTFCTGHMGDTFRDWWEVSMPWKESLVMEERLRFVARLLDGDAMATVCREFGISRKTGWQTLTYVQQIFGAGE